MFVRFEFLAVGCDCEGKSIMVAFLIFSYVGTHDGDFGDMLVVFGRLSGR